MEYGSKILSELRKRDRGYTPDWNELKMNHNELIPVLVYGTLKTGGRFHGALDGCPTAGEALTSSDYKMLMTESFPVVFSGCGSDFRVVECYRVKGEVYLVPLPILARLDEIEANGHMYQRKQVWVSLLDPEQRVTTKTGYAAPSMQCWMYFGIPNAFGGYANLNEVNCLKRIPNRTISVYDWDQYQPSLNKGKFKQMGTGIEDELPNFLKNSAY